MDHGGLSVDGRVGYKDSGCEEGEQHRTYSLHRRHVEPVHAQAVVRVEHRVAAVRVLRALHPPPGKVPQPGRPPPVDAREQERRERGKGIFFFFIIFARCGSPICPASQGHLCHVPEPARQRRRSEQARTSRRGQPQSSPVQSSPLTSLPHTDIARAGQARAIQRATDDASSASPPRPSPAD